jgi:MerR family transcriptional regulator, heat shock protein HspR
MVRAAPTPSTPIGRPNALVKELPSSGVWSSRRPSDHAAMSRAMLTEEEHRPRYSVGQAAEILQTRPRFLHRLDSFEVVRPSRTPGGHRRYSPHELGRIRRVIQLAQEGITLVAIRHIMVLERRVRELEAQRDAAWERLTERDTRPARMRRSRVPPI